MQQWEYRFVRCDWGVVHERIPRWVDDQELPDWYDGPDWQEYVRVLGREGWELCAWAPDETRFDLIFKRPLADSPP